MVEEGEVAGELQGKVWAAVGVRSRGVWEAEC